MTAGREQTRRPPLEADATPIGRDWVEYANHLEQDYRVLKAELEQAERERDEARLERDNWRTARDRHVKRLEQAEAQLAKVPALVEDAPPPRDPTDDDWPTWEENFYRCPNTSAWVYRWSEDRIVAAYEQEQKP